MKALFIIAGFATFIAFLLIGFAFPAKDIDELVEAERDELDDIYR